MVRFFHSILQSVLFETGMDVIFLAVNVQREKMGVRPNVFLQ